MKYKLFIAILFVTLSLPKGALSQNVGIGTTTPHASAALEIKDTTKGLLIPRMTTAQRNAIASPAVGLMILNLDDKCADVYNGTAWIKNCGFTVTMDTTHSDGWTQKTDFGGTARRYAVGFSIGSKGYIGTGDEGSAFKKDFWEYDPGTNVWTQKADFGSTARKNAVGFGIGSKGYIGTGYDGSYTKDLWEYDPVVNTWLQKRDVPQPGRSNAVGFTIGTRGYVGTGFSGSGFLNDFYQYIPSTTGGIGDWLTKVPFGGTARNAAVGFSIGSKGYIGTGHDGSDKKDFWEYDPATGGAGTWTQKTDFGGTIRYYAVGFGMEGKGYIGTGIQSQLPNAKDFWGYNPIENSWQRLQDFPGGNRHGGTGFSIGQKGYMGTGKNGTTNPSFKDFHEFNNAPGIFYTSNIPPSTFQINDGIWVKRYDTVLNAPGTSVLSINGPVFATAFNVVSDSRFKTAIHPLQSSSRILMQLQGVSYNYDRMKFSDRGFSNKLQYGFLAQQVETVLPEIVHTGSDGYKSVNYMQLIPLLTESIKEQQQQLDEQRKINQSLQQQINELKKLLK